MIFPHTVTVHPSELTADSDGNPVRRPRSAGVDVPAFVQPAPAGADENAAQPQTATTEYLVWLDIACPFLDAFAALVWLGEVYELRGDAHRYDSPDRTVDHWRARIRRR